MKVSIIEKGMPSKLRLSFPFLARKVGDTNKIYLVSLQNAISIQPTGYSHMRQNWDPKWETEEVWMPLSEGTITCLTQE